MSIFTALRTFFRTRRPAHRVTPEERVLSLRPTVYVPSSGLDRVRDLSNRVLQGRSGAHPGAGGAPLCCA